MQTVVIITGMAMMIFILSPFWMAKGGRLTSGSRVDDLEQLAAIKKAILKRYKTEEKAAKDELMSKKLWEKRKLFLANRYIDASKRMDFLLAMKKGKGEGYA